VPDLTSQEDVVELMQSSRDVADWKANYAKVKAANGKREPAFFYAAVIASGVYQKWVCEKRKEERARLKAAQEHLPD